ncbi:MAG: hypothetical protein RLZZ381_479 [Cyanobacteriota bacterium]|jgi:uncharacterized protein YhhL (DUF1145 family)
MNLIEEITQILELILLVGAIAASQQTIIAAVSAVAIYGVVKLIKAKRKNK